MRSTMTKEESPKGVLDATAESGLSQKIEHISARVPTAQQTIAELKAEREKLVVPARVDRDEAAQKRIRVIDDQLLTLQRDLTDDQAAVRDLSQRMETTRKARIAAEWEQQRSQIRKRLSARSDGSAVAEALELAGRLGEVLRNLKESDQALRDELVSLAPDWASRWNDLVRLHRGFVNFLGWTLAEVLPIDTRGMRAASLRDHKAKESDRDAVRRVLEQLDDLELVV